MGKWSDHDFSNTQGYTRFPKLHHFSRKRRLFPRESRLACPWRLIALFSQFLGWRVRWRTKRSLHLKRSTQTSSCYQIFALPENLSENIRYNYGTTRALHEFARYSTTQMFPFLREKSEKDIPKFVSFTSGNGGKETCPRRYKTAKSRLWPWQRCRQARWLRLSLLFRRGEAIRSVSWLVNLMVFNLELFLLRI